MKICCEVFVEFMAIETCAHGHWDGYFVLSCLFDKLFFFGGGGCFVNSYVRFVHVY